MSVLSTADRVLGATGELRELRNRLADLDAERAVVEKRIQMLLAEIRGAAVPDTPAARENENRSTYEAPGPQLTSEKILATINQSPDTTFTTIDIVTRWNDFGALESYRAALSRLNKQGKIRRVSQGRYTAVPKGSKH